MTDALKEAIELMTKMAKAEKVSIVLAVANYIAEDDPYCHVVVETITPMQQYIPKGHPALAFIEAVQVRAMVEEIAKKVADKINDQQRQQAELN